jgi:sugar fermentation stimulation protein A
VYVEVKNTTLRLDRDGEWRAAFPDAVTERGRKHLHELMDVVGRGHRAAMVFVSQRTDCEGFTPADEIDPAYGEALRRAIGAGVEAYAVTARGGARGIRPERRLEIRL